ncbi:hypothetical protein [Natronorubrum sp. FCH18a]|uniref:hypothetical protein n=1 Tax=Natronorubrum sp. FCH18a TaxID=3447018 RepID=UPI003F51634B
MQNGNSGGWTGCEEVERTPEEIQQRIELLRAERDQQRELGNDDIADQREVAIISLKWVLGKDISLEERGQ